MSSSRARLVGVGSSRPPVMDQAGLWTDFFARHYSGDPVAERLFAGAAITTRHGVVDPRVEDVSNWGTGARMRRYAEEAPALGKEAVAAALGRAGLAAEDVGLFAVASCTGYVTPGVDIRLARDLGMSAGVERLVVGHMGCYAALPGLAAVSDYVVSRDRPAVLLCVELPSLHVQPPCEDVQQMVAHALFADAAAAVVCVPGGGPGPAGPAVRAVTARTDPATADHMTWDVTDLGFRMGLSPRVPEVLQRHVRGAVLDLLGPHGLTVGDVQGWAVHPGGRRILDVVAAELALPDAALADSRATLDEDGNCSSATVLLVLERLCARHGGRLPSPTVALAFGPGLTLYAALLAD